MPCYETLRRQRDFDRVFDHGTWHRALAFAVGVFERGDNELSRVGFAAGRAVGKPVRRNRVRRRLREAFRAVTEGLRSGADIVVLAREEALGMEFAGLTGAMLRALVEAGLLEGAAGSRDCAQ